MEKEVLSRLYETTNGRKPTKEYYNLNKELQEVKENFLEKVGEDKRAELEHLTDIIYEMNSILGKEDFCNGFSTAVKLYIESTYNNDKGDDQE